MGFIRLRKQIKEKKYEPPTQYRVVTEKRKWKTKKGKTRRIKVRWHYFIANKGGKQSRFVYLKDGIKISSSGRWHLMGFDLMNPSRFVAFYDKKVAKKWAKKNKFKVVSEKRWIKRARKLGVKWPPKLKHPTVRCSHCQKPLDLDQLKLVSG